MTAKIFSIASTPGNPYPTEINIEEQYRQNLLIICSEYDEDEGYEHDAHFAELIINDETNSVRVDIDDLPVGYLSERDASLYLKRLTELDIATPAIGIVTASIRGSFLKHPETAAFDVRLAFLPTNFEPEKLDEITPIVTFRKADIQERLANSATDQPTDSTPL